MNNFIVRIYPSHYLVTLFQSRNKETVMKQRRVCFLNVLNRSNKFIELQLLPYIQLLHL